MNTKPTSTSELRKRRHIRVRSVIKGTAIRPRLSVFRSNRFVSAQLIDDTVGKTIAAAHGRDEFKGKQKGKQSAQAASVGTTIGEKAKAAGITAIVFDRGGYRYAGQVKTLADAARTAGLTF